MTSEQILRNTLHDGSEEFGSASAYSRIGPAGAFAAIPQRHIETRPRASFKQHNATSETEMKTPTRDTKSHRRNALRLSREVLDFLALVAAALAATIFFNRITERVKAGSPIHSDTSDDYEDMIGI